jgi:hypothetical protein
MLSDERPSAMAMKQSSFISLPAIHKLSAALKTNNRSKPCTESSHRCDIHINACPRRAQPEIVSITGRWPYEDHHDDEGIDISGDNL